MKKIQYIASAFLLMFGAVSCEKFIDNPPEDKISVDEYFKTSNDVENYVKKFYEVLPGHGSANLPVSEANSDNLILAVPDNVIQGSRPPRNGQWTQEWENIRSINILFDNIDNVDDDLSTYAQFLGEAYFFRAWFYYDKLQTYGDVPIYDHQLLPGDEDLYKPRDPRTDVADFIIGDLDMAIEHLGLRSETGNARLSKEAALAFKSQVALFEGTWQKYHAGTDFATEGADPAKYFQIAVDAGDELMNGSYTVGIYNTGSPESDYYTLFGLDNMSAVDEVLFYKIASTAEELGHNLQFYVTRRTRDMAITWSLVSSYLGKDGQPYDYKGLAQTTKGNDFLTTIAGECDPRLHATVWIPGDLRVASAGQVFDKPFLNGGSEELCATGFQVKKFSNPYSSAAGADYGGYSQTGRIYFRFGEVLLNYAEAKYELDGTVAYDVLNQLRERAGMAEFEVIPQPAYGDNLVDYGYAIDDALYAIRNERRVELALEGQRIDDYRRWAAAALFEGTRPLGYPFDQSEWLNNQNQPSFTALTNEDGLVDYFQNQMPNGYGFRLDQDYLTSIPSDELVLNPNLEQNPNW
ncbi:RagB/SusD family nutrient uptake outer membrane protein [Echinicola strongylocentroti]|uniref:RagB/SusD family nutrient uptake outer membrane protein n=1 Tax=Echinicola strongylocentroti TaxID=1795355 RepID=A0A2Z4IIC3_9BACT|nr:RagB/SusD family nutrient uptake outer membrane protein [Echinicola strongylocentroti]AWW30881.1 RagB/SusD family nutrient uptake outer membrane protein [Echinicola strongylocentroti]